jgi:hypothetical protein
MKNYNLWHRAQICIFYGMEDMSYIFLWHTWNFLLIHLYLSHLSILYLSPLKLSINCNAPLIDHIKFDS